MNRLLIASSVAAVALAAVPAAVGLSGNPSFSHQLPVTVPSSAQLVSFDDNGNVRGTSSSSSASATSTRTTPTPRPSGTDDRGGQSRHTEPGDDRGGASPTAGSPSAGRSTEPGDDRGGKTGSGGAQPTATTGAAPTTDNRGRGGATRAATPTGGTTTAADDKGGSGRSGKPTGTTDDSTSGGHH